MKRHGMPLTFTMVGIECPEVIGEEICGSEDWEVTGTFEHVEDAFLIATLKCKRGHEIDVDSLSDFDRTRIEERAELHRGDAYASYCEQFQNQDWL